MEIEACTSTLCVNLSTAASSHAQVMGVLAGFVVAAIAVVLERPRLGSADGRAPSHDGIPSLFAALMAFVVAAFLYGIAGGVEATPERTAAMIFAAALPATAAVASLACGLLGLLLNSAHWELTDRGATYMTLAVAGGVSTYVFVSAIDALKVGTPHRSPGFATRLLVIALAAVMILVLSSVVAAAIPRLRQYSRALKVVNRILTNRRRADEAIFGFATLAIILVGMAYFFVLFYAPSVSRAWLVPALTGVWIAYVLTFIDTSSGMQRPSALRTDTREVAAN